jgi:hypothetical protein
VSPAVESDAPVSDGPSMPMLESVGRESSPPQAKRMTTVKRRTETVGVRMKRA